MRTCSFYQDKRANQKRAVDFDDSDSYVTFSIFKITVL